MYPCNIFLPYIAKTNSFFKATFNYFMSTAVIGGKVLLENNEENILNPVFGV